MNHYHHYISMLNTEVTKDHPEADRQNSSAKSSARQTSALKGQFSPSVVGVSHAGWRLTTVNPGDKKGGGKCI